MASLTRREARAALAQRASDSAVRSSGQEAGPRHPAATAALRRRDLRPLRRDRRSGREARRRPRRGILTVVKYSLAACALLGIGVGMTTAAWTEDVAFAGSSSVAPFQMQYSFTNSAGTWVPFPEGAATVTLSNLPAWISPATATATHSIFVRNIGTTSTSVRVEPIREGVFADASVLRVDTGHSTGAMTPLTGSVGHITLSGTEVGRIDLVLMPGNLPSSTEPRTGGIEVRITGTVGTAGASREARSPFAHLDAPPPAAVARRES